MPSSILTHCAWFVCVCVWVCTLYVVTQYVSLVCGDDHTISNRDSFQQYIRSIHADRQNNNDNLMAFLHFPND